MSTERDVCLAVFLYLDCLIHHYRLLRYSELCLEGVEWQACFTFVRQRYRTMRCEGNLQERLLRKGWIVMYGWYASDVKC